MKRGTIGFSAFPYHALLLSAYPLLYLYSHNMVFIPLAETGRSLAFCLGLAAFLLAAFRLILRRWDSAGLLCAFLMVMLLTFGHFANLLPIPVRTLGWIWLALMVLVPVFIVRGRFPASLILVLNTAVLALMIIPLWTIITTQISMRAMDENEKRTALAHLRGQAETEAALPTIRPEQMPDIYYIILDSYERADVLEQHYGFDNSAFINALKDRGFYVADSSRANYLNTTYSLNTALNLIYFGDLPKPLMRSAKTNLRTNYVSDFLRERGYTVVVFDSGTGDSNDQYADHYITPAQPSAVKKKEGLNSYEKLLIRTTIAAVMLDQSTPAKDDDGNVVAASANAELDTRRERITYALDHLDDYAQADGPHFLFSHIYLPHKPFLYGPGAQPLSFEPNMGMYWYEPSPENYVEQYRYQIEYLNGAVLDAIDSILKASKKPTAIILQSDHGDDHFLDWHNPDPLGVDLRSSTLSAIYYSDGDYRSLYPTMTTVNTFRLVLNHWFGTRYPLLPEKVYFHVHPLMSSPGAFPEFLEACSRFKVCVPPAPSLAGR